MRSYTMQELADKSGFTHQYVKDLESFGVDKTPTLEALGKFANALDIDINTVLENEKATVTGSGNHKLVEGKNVITLLVTAEYSSTREYTINVYKDNELETTTKVIDDKAINEQEKKSNAWLFIGTTEIALIGTGYIIINKKRKQN